MIKWAGILTVLSGSLRLVPRSRNKWILFNIFVKPKNSCKPMLVYAFTKIKNAFFHIRINLSQKIPKLGHL